MLEQACRLRAIEQRHLRHAVDEYRREAREALAPQGPGGAYAVLDAALDPPHAREPAYARNVGRLARPGRDRAAARHHQHALARARLRRRLRSEEHTSELQSRLHLVCRLLL